MGGVHSLSWRESYAHLFSEAVFALRSPEERSASWRRWLANPEYGAWVAEVGREIIGFAAGGIPISKDAPRATQLYSIYLLEAHKGTGAGQALLDAAIGDAPAFLWVAEDNPRARAFYARNGFRPDGATTLDDFAGEPISEVRLVR